MKSKKLTSQEINVISNEVNKRITLKTTLELEKKLSKNKDYISLKKKYEERDNLSIEMQKINVDINSLTNNIRKGNDVNIYYINNKLNIYKVSNDINVHNDLYNDIVLMNIDADNNINEMIEKLVNKYS